MKDVRILATCVAALLITCAAVADADEVSAAQASPPYKLEQVRHIDGFAGSDRAREMLSTQGFVVTDQQYRQIFEAYLSFGSEQPLPKFITVDSAWHTYHVLLEDGVRQVELSQAGILRKFSQRLHKLAVARKDQADSVYRDLATFAAVGIALQDHAAVGQLPDDHQAAVQGVLAAIRVGGPPRQGILFFGLPLMPEQFRPVSFYAKTPELSRYFAARQWYATRVFRLESDAETLRALHLALLVESDAELKRLYGRLTGPFEAMVGPADDPGLMQYVQAATKAAGGLPETENVPAMLAAFRREAHRLTIAQVNDQWLGPDDYDNRAERTRGMRVLGPRSLPSAVLFQKTADPAVSGRMFPSGLDVFATGPLACDAGRRALKNAVPNAATAEAIFRADCGPLPDSLHGQAMRLLTLLQKPLPTAVPVALRTPAWHDKQLGTALAAWAEERHTWALHGKMTITFGCMTEEFPGYVSPYPGFYHGLGRLARQAADALRQASPEGPDLVAAGRELLAIMHKREKTPADRQMISMEEIQEGNRLNQISQMYLRERGRDDYLASTRDWSEATEAIKAAAKRCAEDKGVTEADRRYMGAFAKALEGEALELLPEFATLCDQLAAIAQKELDGKKLDRQDANLIRDYGITLARFHFYGGNSYVSPRDDFPMVVPVFISPHGNQAKALLVGVARPEAVYVIISDGKCAALHRGAVLSYREFCRPIEQPLDDDRWADEIRTGKAPPPPPWTASFRQTVTEQDVAALIRAGKICPGVSLMPGREITRAMIDALPRAASMDAYWLREQIQYRATNEDVPSLINTLAELPPDEVGELAMCLVEMENLDWSHHRDKLTSLLTHKTPQVADSAAYLMGHCPESIDVPALADDYARQPKRTRRLYLYVIGRSEEPGPQGEQLLLKALDDPHAAIRYQAAAAVAVCDTKNPAIVARLTAGIDDKNQFTAAAMVRALTRLGVEEAAPRMLARLKGDWLPVDERTPEKAKQCAELTQGTGYGGLGNTQVLKCCRRRPRYGRGIGSLAEELINGLGELGHKPARDELLSFVRAKPPQTIGFGFVRPELPEANKYELGAEALDALLKLDSKRQRDLFLEIISDGKANRLAITQAVKQIRGTSDPSYIEALLPLTDVPGRANYADDFTHEAYWTITRLLASVDTSKPAGAKLLGRVRDRFLQQLRGPNSSDAMDALFRIDRDTALREALAAALDKTASRKIRSNTMFLLRHAPDPSYVEKLLPLLQDESAGRFEGQHLCENAAMAITGICSKLDPKIPDHAKTLERARSAMQKMLRGPHGRAAVESLVQMEGNEEDQAEFILRTAHDRSLAYATRLRAIEMIAESEDPPWVKKLLPLLDDKTRSKEEKLSIGDHAANTIAALLGKDESIDDYTPAAARAEIMRKVRAWAEDE
ncbi:MAG: DUF3160 domain-containing protein [Planctomycetes bacterium]|nr:DUF3160 domain-containing protein [Planctomycetota bacterium]MBL7041404.1 DUF3160 domain-containing protein [Pirellulaceae bacterium]